MRNKFDKQLSKLNEELIHKSSLLSSVFWFSVEDKSQSISYG